MACIESRTCILSTPFITVYDMTMVGHSIGKRVFWFGLAWAMLCNCNLHFWWGIFSWFHAGVHPQLINCRDACPSVSRPRVPLNLEY